MGAHAGSGRSPPAAAPRAVGHGARTTRAAPPPSAAQRAAARRGTLLHQLFERLAGRRARRSGHGAALRWLERSAGVADAAERAGARRTTVCAILADPRFSDLFGPGSLAEAPIAATLPDGRVVAGTVDRLLVEDGRVSVIDFKTGRVPPSDDAIPRLAPRADDGLCRGPRR